LDDGLSIEELADRLGKKAAAIKTALTLRQLEPGIREMVAKGHLSGWDGSRLATLSWNGQNRALDTINREGLTGNDRDRVIGQVWREEHEVSLFADEELPEKVRAVEDARAHLERAVRALARAEELLTPAGGVDRATAVTLPDDMTIALGDEAMRLAGLIGKVTKQAKVARMLRPAS